MKRGKDDDKMMGPMFPRLHVNDTDKGGPRAPPRNKMALYEQFSIPWSGNSGVLQRNPNLNSISNLVPSGSSIQANIPHHCLPSSSSLAEKPLPHQVDGQNLNASFGQLGRGKRKKDEDDFMVPVFVQSGASQKHNNNQNGIDKEQSTPSRALNSSGSSRKTQSFNDDDPKQIGSTGLSLRQNVRNHSVEPLVQIVGKDHSVRSLTTGSIWKKSTEFEGEADTSPNQQHEEHSKADVSRLHENGVCIQQEPVAGLQENRSRFVDGVPELTSMMTENNVPRCQSERCPPKTFDVPKIDRLTEDEFFGSPVMHSRQKNDAKTLMVNSISIMDISPDDVVKLIGQKHFWKARRAIANQQRAFAVQVFELHRLIKVQRLIAGSPHVLLEDSSITSKPSSKSSPTDKLLLEYVGQRVDVADWKDDSEQSNNRMEFSAENAVVKTSFTSGRPSNCATYRGNLAPVPMIADPKMAPWYLPQPLGNQWLIPVMSPSEGLVYKPYAAPGFMGPGCGGCGHFGPIPMNGNFISPTYGGSASYNQAVGMLPGVSPVGHYFPPYGMPAMTPTFSGSLVEHFGGPGSHAQSGTGALLNVPVPGSMTTLIKKARTTKDSEILGSVGSSASDRAVEVGTVQSIAETHSLPCLSTAPAAPKVTTAADRLTRAIKVVPHNARSASESAAWIFQSIQEERKQYDSA